MTAYSPADWGGFGATVATAAATLTGLLFIAVSINLKRILEYPNLPGRVAETLIFFVTPLVVAIFLVVPGQAIAALGTELTATGLVSAAVLLVIDLQSRPSTEETSLGRLMTQTLPVLVSSGCLLAAGLSVLARGGGGLYWLVPAGLVAILAGLVNTWVLLIEILR